MAETDRDPPDTNFLVLLVVAFIGIFSLAFAIFPLIIFTSDPKRMGAYANPLWLKLTGYAVCFVIAALNLYLLAQTAYEHGKLAGALVGSWFHICLPECMRPNKNQQHGPPRSQAPRRLCSLPASLASSGTSLKQHARHSKSFR